MRNALLTHLRRELCAPELQYASPPARILGGNETLIYTFTLRNSPSAFTDRLVLRVFVRGDRLREQRCWEEAVHNTLADMGYPVPRVLHAHEDAGVGGPFVIMERVPGIAMGAEAASVREMLPAIPRNLRSLPRTLADAHLRLHALDPDPLRDRLQNLTLPSEWFTTRGCLARADQLIEKNAHAGLQPGLTWLVQHHPPPAERTVICHGDFHPLNILQNGHEVTGVIDWSNVALAEPEWDVGHTLAILTLTRLSLPAVAQPIIRRLLTHMAHAYLRRYARFHPLDNSRVQYHRLCRVLVELAGFESHLAGARTFDGEGHTASWNYPAMRAFFEAKTGVRIRHPAAP